MDQHQSVLLHSAIEALSIQSDDTVLDATLGGAGHTRMIAELLDERGILIGIDLDVAAIARARTRLAGVRPQVRLIEGNFCAVETILRERGIERLDRALFDLGWSGYQLTAGRGFSFLADEPLIMTYVREPGPDTLTAREIVNEWDESSLADIIFGWGEERYARRIARAIVERRAHVPFSTSRDLADVIKSSVPIAYARGRIHPATRTFQALRITVNDEMGAVQTGLAGAWHMLAVGGRIAVITFHSIEDRAVKRIFAQWEKDGEGKRLTKKPIVPSDEELAANSRARSAKLRVIEKIQTTATN